MAATKAEPKVVTTVVDIRVWCEGCCIRIAPNEERAVVKGKSFHERCYAKAAPRRSKLISLTRP